jgi:acyl-coenzyme A synthetase/AMP-(fatty) acid ligase
MLAELLADIMREHAPCTALSDTERTLTYRDVAEQTWRAAALLARHAAPGNRAGIQATNSAAYVVCYLAMLHCGVVPFLIDAGLGRNELAEIADRCSLDLLVHDGRAVDGLAVAQLGEILGLRVTTLAPTGRRYDLLDSTEVCRFTSGSTGTPNCVEFSGTAVARAAANWSAGTGLSAGDRIACFAALSNGLAFNTSLLAAFRVGASLHLSRGLPTGTNVARRLQQTDATWLVGFPALYDSLVRRGVPAGAFRRVRIALSSAAPLRAETSRTFAELAGISICDYYGVAETGPLTFAAGSGADGGVGAPLPGVTVRAGDTARSPREIRVRSESMGSRYLNAPGVFEARLDADGFYRTGDEGYLSGGSLHLTGRTAATINVGGRKVDPVEVGDVLRRVHGVRDSVVFETTNRHGEPAVAAAVAGDSTLDPSRIRQHCMEWLAGYKVPSVIQVVPDIPVNSIGKPSLPVLRRLVAEAGPVPPSA